MQMQVGALAAIPQLENRTDEQLAERVQAPRRGQGDPRRSRRGALRRRRRAQVLQRGPGRLPPAGAAGAATDDEGLDGARRAPSRRPQGGDGKARPGSALRPSAVHAAHDGPADPARQCGDRGAHPGHRPAGPARDRAARGRPRPGQADRAALRRYRHRPGDLLRLPARRRRDRRDGPDRAKAPGAAARREPRGGDQRAVRRRPRPSQRTPGSGASLSSARPTAGAGTRARAGRQRRAR